MEQENTGNKGTAQETDFAKDLDGPREVSLIDVTKHIGKKVKIENVEGRNGDYGPFFKVETEVVETIEGKEGEIKLRGSKLFGANRDDDGKIWWAEGGKLDTFLKKYKVQSPYDLKGLEVVLQTSTGKDGKDYLQFN